MEIEMCAQGNLVKSKSNKMFILCIHILLCTVLRKAKQDDSEFLVGLLPFQVEKVGWEHFHQLICILSFLVVVFVYFSADCEQSLFFFRFNEGRARASVRRHDKRGRLKPSCACSHALSPRRKKERLLVV